MTSTESYKGNWINPAAFNTYQERRIYAEPALEQLTSTILDETFNAGDTVLEVGSGGGALRKWASDSATELRWLESDHTAQFLKLPRSYKSPQLTVAIPDLPVRSCSLRGVVGLGVFDTLSPHDLSGLAREASRTLEAGGKVMHLLDMSPDYIAEIKNCRAEKLFPLIYKASDEGEIMGISYVALKNLPRRISRLPIQDSVKNIFSAIVEDPDKYVPLTNRTGILQYLGMVAQEYDMVVKSEPSWFGAFGGRLSNAFTNEGFEITTNGLATEEVFVDESEIPPEIQGKGTTRIVRRQGFVEAFADDNLVIQPGKVKVTADCHVFIAEKVA